MINFSKFRKIIFAFAILFTFTIGTVLADDPPGPGGDPNGDWGPVGAPIDGGAIFFLIAGAAYGVKRLRGNKNNKI